MKFIFLFFYFFLLGLQGKANNPYPAQPGSLYLAWPTPNPSFAKGLGYHTFLQKTGPDKEFESGSYGCVRNNGYKFHEGIDLSPVQTALNGRAEDSVFSAMSGIVRHINDKPSDSAFGKYVVLEHTDFNPILYSLYGHLDSIDPMIEEDRFVNTAQRLGRMGNTASFSIPLNRSHLHFEIGIRLSDNFQKWYERQPFKTQNKHGNYNGYNLVGLDPLKFYSAYKNSRFASPMDYIRSLGEITKVQVPHRQTPDLILRNPGLSPSFDPRASISSWICSFGSNGIPLKLTPSGTHCPQIKILEYNQSLEIGRCRKLVVLKNGKLAPSELLNACLEILFID